jgi:predicted nuclease with TOPRIM domain
VAELQRNNTTLFKKLDASEGEVARLRKTLEELSSDETVGNPSARISHLAKKNREMTAAINAEKVRHIRQTFYE